MSVPGSSDTREGEDLGGNVNVASGAAATNQPSARTWPRVKSLAETLSETYANVLPDDEVCACLNQTGSRQVRLYERCQQCGGFMEADYLAARLELLEAVLELARPFGWKSGSDAFCGDPHCRQCCLTRALAAADGNTTVPPPTLEASE